MMYRRKPGRTKNMVIMVVVVGLILSLLTLYIDESTQPNNSTSIPQAMDTENTALKPVTISGAAAKDENTGGKPSIEDKSIKDEMDEYIKSYEEMGWFSGAVLVAKKGEVILCQGYGKANYELDVPNTTKTKFHLGSITKQFTAMAIMMLQERKLLSVNDPLSKYLPDYPNGKNITIHQLLIHTSGIPDYINDDSSYSGIARLYHSPDQIINRFKDKPLEFKPGEKYDYSNSGYFLLSVIIEKVSGKPYYDFLKENIFTPLNMNDTGYDYTQPIVKNRAAGYIVSSGKLKNADFFDRSNIQGADGLYSTVEDLYLWDRALYAEQLVSRDTLDKIFTPYPPAKNYGYGWRTTNKVEMKHGGRMDGFYNLIARNTKDESVIIVLSNIEQIPLGTIGGDLNAILCEKEYNMPKDLKLVKY